MQKAETNAIDAQAVQAQPKLIKLIEISVDEAQKFYIKWELDKKDLTISALAEGIKLVATYQKPEEKIIKPQLSDFLLGRKP